MRVSMERLLSGVVDFAGMFPPARMTVEASLDRYLRGLSGGEGRVLGRFVCATDSLADLADGLDQVPLEAPIAISAVGRGSEDRESWEAALAHDAGAMNSFSDRVGTRAQIEAYEVRLPPAANLETCVQDLRGFSDAEVFVELALGERVEDAIARLADTEELGAKLRTGGVEVSAVPSGRGLAHFLRACVELELPFKLTAGLHHPIRRYDPVLGGHVHGFINALTATALALSEDLSRREMESILDDEHPSAWTFDDRGMTWRDFRVDLEGLEETRELFVAFGSCSIDDPMDGLREAWGIEVPDETKRSLPK